MSARTAVIVLAFLMLGCGCSVQMAYNNLDRLARWSVSDYIDLTDAQREYFDGELALVWDWHRVHHLPLYAATLDRLAVGLPEGTDDARMRALVDQVITWAEEVEERAMPMATQLLASLSDDQVRDLARRLEEDNEEMAEPEVGLSLADAQELWREEVTERFSEFSGRLGPLQRSYLESQSHDYLPERIAWADYRRRWQADLLALLAYRGDVSGFSAALRELAAQRESYYGDDLQRVTEANQRLMQRVSIWLINSLDENQQARMVERLSDLAEDFRELAQQPLRAPRGMPPPCLVDCAGSGS